MDSNLKAAGVKAALLVAGLEAKRANGDYGSWFRLDSHLPFRSVTADEYRSWCVAVCEAGGRDDIAVEIDGAPAQLFSGGA
jgi:hypothetical protein